MAWWNDPNNPKFTNATLPPDAPAPGANAVWPIRERRSRFVARFIAGRGPNSGRALGYRRQAATKAGPTLATHAGIDVFGKFKDTVVACEDGRIVNFYHFYLGTFALIVDHGRFVINYGEVDRSSLEAFGLKTPSFIDSTRKYGGTGRRSYRFGSRGASSFSWIAATGSEVKAGQPIALVGKMTRSSMLHFEMYVSGTTANRGWGNFPNGAPPSGMLNPTNYLLALSRTQPRKEPTVTTTCR